MVLQRNSFLLKIFSFPEKEIFPAAPGKKGFQTEIWPMLFSEKVTMNLVFTLSPAVQEWLSIGISNKFCLLDCCHLSSELVIPLVHYYLYSYLLWSTCPNPLDKNPFKFSWYFFPKQKNIWRKGFHGRDLSKIVEYRRIFFLGREFC